MDPWDSPGSGDLVLCLGLLDRPLTERERFWFETAEAWRDPSPSRFLVNGAHVSFLCTGVQKERWEQQLASYLRQAWNEA